MLVLLRAVGKKLKIGNDITVSILGMEGNAVRIGVEAPDDVSVRGNPSTAVAPSKDKDKQRRGEPVES